jgi:putative nucleotidyltransferase with HDIG domain
MADMSAATYDDLVRRLAAAIRSATLYSPSHPLVQRGIDAVAGLCASIAQKTDPIVIGFIGDEVVVNATRLPKSAAALVGFARDMREREIEKITLQRGVTKEELRTFVFELPDRRAITPLATRLQQKGVTRITIGRLTLEKEEESTTGIVAARKIYGTAVETAQQLWDQAKSGDKPDPNAARKIIDSLAKMVGGDRTSLMALTALKRYDNYTFTHMVNVSVLAMAQARSLNMDGALLREFGFAALMHDIGKVHTPQEVLNKPDKLTKEEYDVMQRHARISCAGRRKCLRWRRSSRSSTICGRIYRATRAISGRASSTCAPRSSASRTCTMPCAAPASTARDCRATASSRSWVRRTIRRSTRSCFAASST